MANHRIIPTDTLRQLLILIPEIGELIWKQRPVELFKSKRAFDGWNTKWAGKPAFTSVGNHGYRLGAVFNKCLLAHRVVWAIHYGEWPVSQIDHINGIRTDNRISNLRAVNNLENSKNGCLRSRNTSGHNGISWHSGGHKWAAAISVKYETVYLGLFDAIEDAIAARKAAEIKYNFHPNHGRKAA